jgi:hypothetical protein
VTSGDEETKKKFTVTVNLGDPPAEFAITGFGFKASDNTNRLDSDVSGSVSEDTVSVTIDAPPSTVPVFKTGQTTKYLDGDDGDLERGRECPSPWFTDNGDNTRHRQPNRVCLGANCVDNKSNAWSSTHRVGNIPGSYAVFGPATGSIHSFSESRLSVTKLYGQRVTRKLFDILFGM